MSKKLSAEPPLDPDRLLTINEVAALLHVSRSLLYRLIRTGALPTVRILRALRFRWQDVEDYINTQAAGGRGRRSRKKKGTS